MAQKKESRTQEMQLAAAKIPAEAWPYALPEGWTWVRLGKITRNHGQKKPDHDFTYIDIGSIDNEHQQLGSIENRLSPEDAPSRARKIVKKGDILYSTVRPYLHNMCRITQDITPEPIASTGFAVLSPTEEVDGAFLFEFLRTQMMDAYANDPLNARGINYPAIQERVLLQAPVPLPPLAVQKNLVRRIESLFSKLDVVAEKIDAADAAFVAQKNALLHAAFDGTLTEAWREKNGTDRSWTMTPIKALCKRLQYGTAKKSEKAGKLPVVRMGNLQDGEILWDDLVYSNDEDDIKKYLLHDGDVLFNRTNSAALVGKTSIYRGQQPAIFAGYLIRLDYDKERILGDFLNYALNTVDAKNYCHQVKVDGVNQSNINAQKIGAYQIPLPPLSEQHEIVRRLDALLGRLTRARAAVGEARAQIASLRTSILARAFRGEL